MSYCHYNVKGAINKYYHQYKLNLIKITVSKIYCNNSLVYNKSETFHPISKTI